MENMHVLEKRKDPKVASVVLSLKTTSDYRNLKVKPMYLVTSLHL